MSPWAQSVGLQGGPKRRAARSRPHVTSKAPPSRPRAPHTLPALMGTAPGRPAAEGRHAGRASSCGRTRRATTGSLATAPTVAPLLTACSSRPDPTLSWVALLAARLVGSDAGRARLALGRLVNADCEQGVYGKRCERKPIKCRHKPPSARLPAMFSRELTRTAAAMVVFRLCATAAQCRPPTLALPAGRGGLPADCAQIHTCPVVRTASAKQRVGPLQVGWRFAGWGTAQAGFMKLAQTQMSSHARTRTFTQGRKCSGAPNASTPGHPKARPLAGRAHLGLTTGGFARSGRQARLSGRIARTRSHREPRSPAGRYGVNKLVASERGRE